MTGIWGLVACVVGCLLVGTLGSVVTRPALDGWYARLEKPPFNPPNWLFPPVWTTLFIFMGVALWLVLRADPADGQRTLALVLFGVQLVLNFLWSLFFFGLKSPGLAMVELLFFWAALVATIVLFLPLSTWAGLLFLPYLAWVSFAGILNFELWRRNRGAAQA
jgi:tryptophan-rich sensory protein